MESCADNTNAEEMQNGFPEVPTFKKRRRKQDEPAKWKNPDQQGLEGFLNQVENDTVTLQQLQEGITSIQTKLEKKPKRVTLIEVNEKIDKVLEILHSWNTPV